LLTTGFELIRWLNHCNIAEIKITLAMIIDLHKKNMATKQVYKKQMKNKILKLKRQKVDYVSSEELMEMKLKWNYNEMNYDYQKCRKALRELKKEMGFEEIPARYIDSKLRKKNGWHGNRTVIDL